MTAQQPYDVIQRNGSYELRRYPEHLVAEVTVTAGFEDAGNKAFRYLFGYISGENGPRPRRCFACGSASLRKLMNAFHGIQGKQRFVADVAVGCGIPQRISGKKQVYRGGRKVPVGQAFLPAAGFQPASGNRTLHVVAPLLSLQA